MNLKNKIINEFLKSYGADTLKKCNETQEITIHDVTVCYSYRELSFYLNDSDDSLCSYVLDTIGFNDYLVEV